MTRWLRVVAVAVALLFGLTACAGEPQAPPPADVVVIDVRTPEEFADGHLDGALNLNLQDPGFGDAVAALPREDSYLVYCRSGNRSAQAAEIMRGLGFEAVTDAGPVQAAADLTGRPVVTS